MFYRKIVVYINPANLHMYMVRLARRGEMWDGQTLTVGGPPHPPIAVVDVRFLPAGLDAMPALPTSAPATETPTRACAA
jgi:hypothetical protein